MRSKTRATAVDPSLTESWNDQESVSDEWLMRAYLAGNHAALAALIRRYERELFSYLRRMLADGPLAEDVFQNTFMQLHQKRHLYEVDRAFRPWLYTIATNQAIDLLRRNHRHRNPSLDVETTGENGRGTFADQIPDESIDPLELSSRNERKELVRQAVDQLAEHLRVVVVLAYYQGMKYKDIAAILDIPVGTVKSRLHAAVQRLGTIWTDMGLVEA